MDYGLWIESLLVLKMLAWLVEIMVYCLSHRGSALSVATN